MASPFPPTPPGPVPEQLAVELAAVAGVTAGLRAQLEQATRQIIGVYIAYAGSLNNPIPRNARHAFTAAVSRVIATVVADIREPLWMMLWRALYAGQTTALSYLPDVPLSAFSMYGAAAYHEAVAGAPAAAATFGGQAAATAQWAGDIVYAAQARMDAALLSARAAGRTVLPADITFNDVLGALAPLHQSLGNLDRDTRWAVNAAFNQATRDLADRHGSGRMWVAERDACLHCLALSGQVVGPGQPFDGAATFYVGPDGGLKPLPVYPAGPLWGPPRHPNCRCYTIPTPQLEGYPVHPWETRAVHPSEALQREARRSVLRGDSGSDSLPARLRATGALLAVGARLPRSVQARARAALRARRYPDRRWDRP